MTDDPVDEAPPPPRTAPTRRDGAPPPARVAEGTPTVDGSGVADRVAGEILGAYRIVRSIASGGFGTVYQAEHTRLARAAAIKVLHADGAASREVVARFEREAQLVNLIRHPNVVDIYDFGELDDGRPYFVMELLHGEDLRAFLAREGAVSLPTALELLAPLCDALDAAHAKGIVHRDLKPSNVFVATAAGGGRRVVLLDFGVAKLLGDTGPSLTRSRQSIGTPTSMAPEQVRGEAVDARTDVYALGNLIYTMLTGRAPYAAETAVMSQYMHLFADPPRPSLVAPLDPRCDDVVARAMAKDPARRHATAGELLAELRAACDPAAESRRGQDVLVAVVLVHVAAGALTDPDDVLLGEIDRVLCEGGAALTAAGFAPVIEGADRVVLRRELVGLALVRNAITDLVAQVARRVGGVGVGWSIVLHVGTAGGQDDPLDLGGWLPVEVRPGLVVTAAAAAVLGVTPPST